MAATLRRKCSGGTNFAIMTKLITKIIVPRNYFVIISARMVQSVRGTGGAVLVYHRPQNVYVTL